MQYSQQVLSTVCKKASADRGGHRMSLQSCWHKIDNQRKAWTLQNLTQARAQDCALQ